jgi:hypothetical protein
MGRSVMDRNTICADMDIQRIGYQGTVIACSTVDPWTLRLTPVLLAFAGDFDDGRSLTALSQLLST